MMSLLIVNAEKRRLYIYVSVRWAKKKFDLTCVSYCMYYVVYRILFRIHFLGFSIKHITQ
jgi:hypothetical protein